MAEDRSIENKDAARQPVVCNAPASSWILPLERFTIELPISSLKLIDLPLDALFDNPHARDDA